MTFEEIAPLIFMGGVLFILFYMNFRRTKKAETMQNTIAEGDEIVLHSGIHGFVASVDPDVIWLEISEGTEIKVAKAAVQSVVAG